MIVVSDNGCGMAPEVVDRIWEPFFTTKGEQGTGLGLDVAKSIIEGHGGTIECVTELGAGSTFTIRLPRIAADRSKSLTLPVEGAMPANLASFTTPTLR